MLRKIELDYDEIERRVRMVERQHTVLKALKTSQMSVTKSSNSSLS